MIQFLVFLVDPVSVAAVDGTTVEFSCTAENVEEVLYRVNGSSAANEEFHVKGFFQQPHEVIFGTIIRRNLTVAVSSQYNNTEIFCRGFGELNNVNSEIANLTVQGIYITNIKNVLKIFLSDAYFSKVKLKSYTMNMG